MASPKTRHLPPALAGGINRPAGVGRGVSLKLLAERIEWIAGSSSLMPKANKAVNTDARFEE